VDVHGNLGCWDASLCACLNPCLRIAEPSVPVTDTRPDPRWALHTICCTTDDGWGVFESWGDAERQRQLWVESATEGIGHSSRSGIIRETTPDAALGWWPHHKVPPEVEALASDTRTEPQGWSSARRLAFTDAATAFRRAASHQDDGSPLHLAYTEGARVLASWGEDETRIDGPLNAQRAIDLASDTRTELTTSASGGLTDGSDAVLPLREALALIEPLTFKVAASQPTLSLAAFTEGYNAALHDVRRALGEQS
jgi:hypothetical protein